MLFVAALLIAIPAFLAGRAVTPAPQGPIEDMHGVPIGVLHTRVAAVAAAESYLATEQAAVERDPPRFQRLVFADYLRRLQASALTAARSERLQDAGGMTLWRRGGKSFTVIGAARVAFYRGESAQVTTWAGQIFWGPGQEPTQVWSLSQTTVVWQTGRWQVSAMSTLPEPAPSPSALPQASPDDDSAAALDAQLAGFTNVSYGAPG